jgi:hypothetical protein
VRHAAWHQTRPAVSNEIAKATAVVCMLHGGCSSRQRYFGIVWRVEVEPSQASTNSERYRALRGRSINPHCLYCNSSHSSCHLHWIPVDFRVMFKLAKFAFISCSASSVPYICIICHSASRNHQSCMQDATVHGA